MKYEYKIIVLCEYDDALYKEKMESLNEWFDKGWEYVETLQQKVTAAGQTSHSKFPSVGVILRREKITDPLN